MINTTLPNKSGNAENLEKIIILVGKLFNYCAHNWRGFGESVLQDALLTDFVSSDQ